MTKLSSQILSKLLVTAFVILLLLTFLPYVVGLTQPKNIGKRYSSIRQNNNNFLYQTTKLSINRIKSYSKTSIQTTSDIIINDDNNENNPVPKSTYTENSSNIISNTFRRLKQWLIQLIDSIKEKQLLSKGSVAKMGMYVLLSYGFVSNISSITCLIISWVIFGKTKHVSPLAPGEWKGLLAIYAGIWAANNFLRPLRISIALLIAPKFEKFIQQVESKTGWKRSVATGFVVFLVNVVGTISYLCTGLFIVTTLLGVPLFPPIS